MTTFILISAAMIVAAVLLLAPALLRRFHTINEATNELNIGIARERLSEIEKEQQKGELSEEEFAQAKQDLEIALAQDLSTASSSTEHRDNRKTALTTLLLVAVLIPAIVVPMYLHLGSPQHLDVVGPGTPAVAKQGDSSELPPIADLLVKLEKRLAEDPNNPQGWYMLGRTYMKLKKYQDAVRSFDKLNEILPNDANVMLSLSDALAMNNGGILPPRAVNLLRKTLEIEPNSTTALWLSGNAAADAGNDKQALDFWRRAYPLLSDQPQMQSKLGEMITQIEGRSGITAEPLQASAPQQPVAPAQVTAVSDADSSAGGLRIEVALDAEMLDQVSPQDTVFIYAKAASGPPMPLAVARKTVADLPVSVVLNDSMAMMPQMKLSSFEQVKVGARITKSGRPIAQSGDLQSAETQTDNNNTETLQLLINSKVQ